MDMFHSGVQAAIFLFLAFQVKHLIVDFFLQPPYMWRNKGKLLHPGGWLHAGGHAVASYLIFSTVHPEAIGPGIPWLDAALALCVIELFAHFLIDLSKVRISQFFDWRPETSPKYWYLLGIDQFLHQLTYLWMIAKWLL